MNGYTKLFSTILDSTIWREPKEVKILWITMLAMADQHGRIEASLPGLADRARLTLDETESSLSVLMAPDRYSRTKDNDGRRISQIDGGWTVLNHAKYRAMLSRDERREYQKRWDKEHRPRRRKAKSRQNPTNPTQAEAIAKERKLVTTGTSAEGGLSIGFIPSMVKAESSLSQ